MAGESAGRIDLDLELNYGAFQRQLSGIAGTANGMVGSAFKGLGGIIAGAFAVKGLVDFGREAIGLASDLQEVQNVVDVTFGGMAQDINNWSKGLINSFGLSELSAKKYSSTMGAMLKSSGLAGVQMEGMSKQLTELAADMASFYNLSNQESFEKVFSGMTGETEPLKALGINMSVANMEAYAMSQGIDKAWNSMSQMEQTMLRYGYLMKTTADAQGDFARTSNSWANQTRVLTEQWNIFKGTMGAGFINILTPVIKGINWLIAKLQVAAAYFKAFSELIFGNAAGGSSGGAAVQPISDMGTAAGGTAGALGDLGGAADKTGKKAKKAGKDVKGSLAGFDQLNILADSAAGALDDAADSVAGVGAGLGAGLGGGFGDLDLGTLDVNVDPIKQKVQGLITEVKSAFAGAWGYITEGWNNIAPAMQPLMDAMVPIKASVAGIGETFGMLWNNVLVPFAAYMLGDFIPTIAGSILTNLVTVVADALVGAFDLLDKTFANVTTTMTDLLNNTWIPSLDIVKNAFVENMPQMATALDSLIQDTILPAADFFANGFVLPISKSIIETFVPILATTAAHAIEVLADTMSNFAGRAKELWEGTLMPQITRLRDVILEIVPQIGGAVDKLLNEFLVPFVDYAINDFIMPIAQKITEVLAPVFTDILVTAFQEASSAFEWAVDMIVDIYNTLIKPTFDLIKQIVLDVLDIIKKAWDEHGQKILDGVKEFLNNVKNTLKKLWDEVLKPIIEPFLKTMKELWEGTISKIIDKVVNLVAKLIESALEIYNDFISPLINYVIDLLAPAFVKGFNIALNIVKTVIEGIGEFISGLLDALDGLIDFVTGVFTGNWSKAWEGVKKIFKGVFDSLWGIVKIPLNLIIDGINHVIDALNSISIDIPEIDVFGKKVGGGSIGINLNHIPPLARGGIISTPTIAQIGERGTEAVVPLENTPFVDKLASALGTAVLTAMQMGQASSGTSDPYSQQETTLQIDGVTLARVLAPYLAQENKRTGSAIIRNVTTAR